MRTFLCMLFLCPVLLSFGQKNFLPGFIVSSPGDTTRGNIKYGNWEINPRKIEFRQDGKEPVTLGLKDLVAFEIAGEDRYEKHEVLKSGRPTDINRLAEPFPENAVTDTVFLRVVVKDQVSLYELVDNRTYYFMSNADGEPKELQHWLEPQVQSSDFYTINTFKDQLRGLIAGSGFDKGINNRINNLTYNEERLTDVVNRINLLKGSVVNTWQPAKKNNTYFFVGSGVNIGRIDFRGYFAELTNLDYSTSVTPSFRAGVDFASSRNMQRLILRTELIYHSLKFTGTSVMDKGSVFERDIQYDLQLKMVSPTLHILYIVSQSPADVYLGLGLNWNFTTSSNRHVSTYVDGRQEVKDPYLDAENGWLGLNSKVGVRISEKLDFNVNYRLGGGFLVYNKFSAGANMLGLELNYRFQHSRGKK